MYKTDGRAFPTITGNAYKNRKMPRKRIATLSQVLMMMPDAVARQVAEPTIPVVVLRAL